MIMNPPRHPSEGWDLIPSRAVALKGPRDSSFRWNDGAFRILEIIA